MISYTKILNNFFVFITIFLVLLIITYLNIIKNGINLHCGVTTISASILEIINLNPSCDAGVLLQASLEFKNSGLSEINEKIKTSWSPGMLFFFTTLLWIFNEQLDLLFIMIILNLIIIAAIFAYLFTLFNSLRDKIILSIILIFLILSSPLRGWILESGLLYPEGIATFSVIISLLLIIRPSENAKIDIIKVIFSGIFLGLAAHFRPQFELQTIIGLIVFGLFYAFIRTFYHNLKLKKSVEKILVIFVIALTTTIPWRIYLLQELETQNFNWTQSYNNSWISWVPTEDLALYNISLDSSQGGINLLCNLDKIKCKELHKSLPEPRFDQNYSNFDTSDFNVASRDFYIKNFYKFVQNKIRILYSYWIQDNSQNYLRQTNGPEAIFLLSFLLVTPLIFIYLLRKNYEYNLLLYFLIYSNFLILLFHHIESRYFITIKILLFFSLISLVFYKSRDSIKL